MPHPTNKPLSIAALAHVVCVLLACALLACALAPSRALAASGTAAVSAEQQSRLLEHASIGVRTGSISEQQVEKAYPEADIQHFTGTPDIINALVAGKLDYAMATESVCRRYMATNDSLTYLEPAFYTVDENFALQKGNDELKGQINDVLAQMRESGELDRIYEKWTYERDYSMDDVPARTDGPVLKVAICATNEPKVFVQDGRFCGTDIEICLRVAYELGYQVEFQDMAFNAELASVVSGKSDLALSYSRTDEREKELAFSDAYTHDDIVFLANKSTVAEYLGQSAGGGSSSDSVDAEATAAGALWSLAASFERSFIAESRWKLVLDGLGITLTIATGSFALASAAGAGLCAAGRSNRAWLRGAARAYGKLASGIPLLVWLMVTYYVFFAGVDVPAALVAVLALGLVSAAPMAKVYDTGLAAVDKGEVEAALAMGFSDAQAFRHIALPQAAGHVWGLYAAEFTSLIKATSIVGYVAITDLTKASDIIRSRTFEPFFPLLATAVVYFAVIALAAQLFGLAARRMDPRRRSLRRVLRGVDKQTAPASTRTASPRTRTPSSP